MIIPFLLAASYFVQPVPQVPGSFRVTQEPDYPMATDQYPMNDMARAVDAINVGSPVQTRDEYDFNDLEHRFPVRTIVPSDQRNLTTLPEQLAQQQYMLIQKKNQVDLQAQMLDNTIRSSTFDYNSKILQQAQAATQKLGSFNPYDPNFQQNWSNFQTENPLAFQNPGFRDLADRLVTTHQQIQQTGAAREARVAAGGSPSLNAYHTAIQSGKTPFEAQASAADAEAQQSASLSQQKAIEDARRELIMKGGPTASGAYDDAMTQEVSRVGKLKSLRQQLVDSGDQDLVSSFDQKYPKIEVDPNIALGKASGAMAEKVRQDAQLDRQNRPLNRVDYTELLATNRKMLEAATDQKYENLSSDDKTLFDFNREQANRYVREQKGGTSITPVVQEGKTATNPKTGKKLIYRNGKWEPVQ